MVEYEFSEEDWEDLTVYEAGASGPSAFEAVPTCISSVALSPSLAQVLPGLEQRKMQGS